MVAQFSNSSNLKVLEGGIGRRENEFVPENKKVGYHFFNSPVPLW
jgi:hypothetical protein